MRLRYLRYFLLAFLPMAALYLQATLFRRLTVDGVLPDGILIFVLFFALLNGDIHGGVYGLCCGLLEDFYLGRFIGVNMLTKGLTGYLLGKFNRQINPESPWVGPLGVFLGGMLHAALFGLLMLFFDLYLMDIGRMLKIFAVQILYQTMLSIPLYWWYYHSHSSGWLKPAEEEDRLWNRMNKLVK